MPLARLVTFDGVSSARMEQMKNELSGQDPREDIPATDFIMLYDAEAERSVAILFFANEDDYARGDATLNAMPADETPGSRTSVGKYEVAIRETA
jgi:hypothetical protein